MSRYGRRGRSRLSVSQPERLVQAIAGACLTAMEKLPPLCRRFTILAGMAALAGIIIPWAPDDAQRAGWPRDAYIDMHAHARILRNGLHNISLAEEIAERAHRRRAEVIHPLLRTECNLLTDEGQSMTLFGPCGQ